MGYKDAMTDELDVLRQRVETLEEHIRTDHTQLKAIYEEHTPKEVSLRGTPIGRFCPVCFVASPCRTLKILSGDLPIPLGGNHVEESSIATVVLTTHP